MEAGLSGIFFALGLLSAFLGGLAEYFLKDIAGKDKVALVLVVAGCISMAGSYRVDILETRELIEQVEKTQEEQIKTSASLEEAEKHLSEARTAITAAQELITMLECEKDKANALVSLGRQLTDSHMIYINEKFAGLISGDAFLLEHPYIKELNEKRLEIIRRKCP